MPKGPSSSDGVLKRRVIRNNPPSQKPTPEQRRRIEKQFTNDRQGVEAARALRLGPGPANPKRGPPQPNRKTDPAPGVRRGSEAKSVRASAQSLVSALSEGEQRRNEEQRRQAALRIKEARLKKQRAEAKQRRLEEKEQRETEAAKRKAAEERKKALAARNQKKKREEEEAWRKKERARCRNEARLRREAEEEERIRQEQIEKEELRQREREERRGRKARKKKGGSASPAPEPPSPAKEKSDSYSSAYEEDSPVASPSAPTPAASAAPTPSAPANPPQPAVCEDVDKILREDPDRRPPDEDEPQSLPASSPKKGDRFGAPNPWFVEVGEVSSFDAWVQWARVRGDFGGTIHYRVLVSEGGGIFQERSRLRGACCYHLDNLLPDTHYSCTITSAVDDFTACEPQPRCVLKFKTQREGWLPKIDPGRNVTNLARATRGVKARHRKVKPKTRPWMHPSESEDVELEEPVDHVGRFVPQSYLKQKGRDRTPKPFH